MPGPRPDRARSGHAGRRRALAKAPRTKIKMASDLGSDHVERVTGIEPALSAWEADVLPLNYTRGRPSLYLFAGPGAHDLPRSALGIAKSSVGAGYAVASRAPAPFRDHLLADVQGAFLTGLHAGCYVAAGVCAMGLVIAFALPGAPPSVALVPAAPAIE